MLNDELDRKVLFWIQKHAGKANAINRWELAENVFDVHIPIFEQNDDNLLDRDIRYAVGRLRADGHLICDLGDGSGRYMAETEHEFWEFYSYYVKPIQARANVAKAMKEAAKAKWPNLLQPSLFDVMEMA